MIKLKLYPSSGTTEDAKALKFEVSGVEVDSIHVSIENATHGNRGAVTDLQAMGDGTYFGFADIRIPAHLTHSMISIFAHVEEILEDGSYRTIQICPTIFTVVDDTEGISEPLSVHPSFMGPDDICSIRIYGKPNSKKVVSVNDKFFRTTINNDGFGSVSFKGTDVVGSTEIDVSYQLPIYLYDEKDNFTKKVFSDSYLNILPSSIAMHADPRCVVGDDAYVVPPWEMPAACIEDPDPPIVDPVIPVIPPTALPTSCKEDDVTIVGSRTCKIFSHDVTILNNGMAVHAYLSPDVTVADSDSAAFNKNRVFLVEHQTTLDVKVIANADVAIEPKAATENFLIHVQEEVWDAMVYAEDTSASDIYVVLYNRATGFQRIKIIDRILDEYTGSYILVGEMEDDFLIIRDWIFCVNAVFYHASESPNTNLDPDFANATGSMFVIPQENLTYVVDSDANILQAVNVSIASNIKYIDDTESSYIYLIVEAIVGGYSQLFFTSAKVGENDSYTTTEYIQLTSNGNNQNPVAKIGSDNNLHVMWESDRAGIKQIYYGVLGMSMVASACTVFSASIDKYSEFLSSNDVPFDYLSANFLTIIDDPHEYDPSSQVADYISSDLLDSPYWNTYGSSGSISEIDHPTSYLNDLIIVGNPLTQDALAFQSIQIVDPLDDPSIENPSTDSIPYTQFNYQINFNLNATVAQDSRLATIYDGTIIDKNEMDNIFSDWKSEFILSIDPNVNNQSVYTKDGNSFVIGRVDGVFDRIVPLVGSYKLDSLNPSVDRFQIDITNDSNNLNDFTFGLMFEKTRFRATNIIISSEFSDNPSDYVESEIHTIYTGMAKLVAFIKTEDVEIDRANYIIVREFPEKLDLTVDSIYTIIINYTAIDSDGVTTLLNTYEQTYDYKFIGQVTLLIDGVPRFSQSFISTISDAYNYFDIGFGIPYGGYYIADKMSPSKLGIYDNVVTTLLFSDISISSPTYTYNTDIINLPSEIRNMTKFRVADHNSSVFQAYIGNLGIGSGIVFTQIPITFEGINQSPNITLGSCDDIHLAWQSNRDRHWNIFYSNATDKLAPFRFNTQITDTTSNSLRPSVAVSRTGARLITWHDDRNGNYDIFAARSTEGYSCNSDKCKREQAESFDYDIIECDISIEYEAVVGTYSLSLEFYKDAALNELYTTINMDGDNVSRWFVDDTAVAVAYDDLSIQGVVFSSEGDVIVSYIPDKDDDIFDIVLYIKLVSTVVTG